MHKLLFSIVIRTTSFDEKLWVMRHFVFFKNGLLSVLRNMVKYEGKMLQATEQVGLLLSKLQIFLDSNNF